MTTRKKREDGQKGKGEGDRSRKRVTGIEGSIVPI